MSQQFCFDDEAAAKAAIGEAPRLRVYKTSSPKLPDVTKFVIAPSRELAGFRFASEFLSLDVSPSKAPSAAASKGVTQKQIDQLIDKAASSTPEEATKILTEVKSLKDQLAEARARRKANKVNPAAPAAPPAPPANVPAPPAP